MDTPTFLAREMVPGGSATLSLHILVLGEQSVKDPQSGFEVQVHHICRRKQRESAEEEGFQEL